MNPEGSAETYRAIPRSVALWVTFGYLALFIIRPWEMLFPWMSEIRLERLYALFMIVVVVLSGRLRLRLDLQTLTVMLFCVAVSVSGMVAWDRALAWESVYQYWTVVLFYLVIVGVLRSRNDLVWFIIAYLTIMAAYLGKSQWEYFVHGAGRYDMGVHRMWGIEFTYGYPNAVAESIVFSLPLLVFLWKTRREVTAHWPGGLRKLVTLLCVLYFALAVSSLVLTNSRTGMIAFGVFAILLGVSAGGLFRVIVQVCVGVGVLSLLWMAAPQETKDRLRTLWDASAGPESAQTSAIGRVEGFRAGWTMFQRRPLLGVGPGNFAEYRLETVDGIALSAHSLAGQALGEVGAVGAACFILLVASIWWNSRRLRRCAEPATREAESIWTRLGYAARDATLLLLICGLSGHNLYRFQWLWVGAFCAKGLELARAEGKGR